MNVPVSLAALQPSTTDQIRESLRQARSLRRLAARVRQEGWSNRPVEEVEPEWQAWKDTEIDVRRVTL